jgi:hypothetical protein
VRPRVALVNAVVRGSSLAISEKLLVGDPPLTHGSAVKLRWSSEPGSSEVVDAIEGGEVVFVEV